MYNNKNTKTNMDPNSIPMPPPAANTLMRLQSNSNSNSAYLPSNNHNTQPGGLPNLTKLLGLPPVGSNTINLSQSSDVVIGPMTQYQNDVTIYQYMDATIDSTRHGHGPNLSVKRNPSQLCGNCLCFKNIPRWLLILLVIAIGLGISLGIIFGLYADGNSPLQQNKELQIQFGKNYDKNTIPNLGNGHLVIDRKNWGSSHFVQNINRYTRKMQLPVSYVVITHSQNLDAQPCYSLHSCMTEMRNLQDRSITEQHLIDLKANFYVGGDGYVYVGRSWDYVNYYNDKSLLIQLMGNYDVNKPTKEQLEALQFLLSYGTGNKQLVDKYKLISQNQTMEVISPGENIYREITNWKRWWDCDFRGINKCGNEIGIENNWNQKN